MPIVKTDAEVLKPIQGPVQRPAQSATSATPSPMRAAFGFLRNMFSASSLWYTHEISGLCFSSPSKSPTKAKVFIFFVHSATCTSCQHTLLTQLPFLQNQCNTKKLQTKNANGVGAALKWAGRVLSNHMDWLDPIPRHLSPPLCPTFASIVARMPDVPTVTHLDHLFRVNPPPLHFKPLPQSLKALRTEVIKGPFAPSHTQDYFPPANTCQVLPHSLFTKHCAPAPMRFVRALTLNPTHLI